MPLKHNLLRTLVLCLSVFASVTIKAADGEVALKHVFDSLELIQWRMPLEMVKRETTSPVHYIRINNQNQFEQLTPSLKTALNEGRRNVCVIIKEGRYLFKEHHLNLDECHFPDAEITIKGKNVVVVPEGKWYADGDTIHQIVDGESCFLNSNNDVLPTWGELMYADSLIEVTDTINNICRIRCKRLENLQITEGGQAYIQVTRWCRCIQYNVVKIENGYVYFKAHDLEYSSMFIRKGYNVNYDYLYALQTPRFRLCNIGDNSCVSILKNTVTCPAKDKAVYLCSASNFLTSFKTELKSLTIQGLTFLGGRSAIPPLLYFHTTNYKRIEISNCNFIGQKNRLLNFNFSQNLLFTNNVVKENYTDCISCFNATLNTFFTDNVFENNGLSLSSNRCVSCSGRNYYIARNTFKDFGYCAISVGMGYNGEMRIPTQGVVEYNHMYYDQEHFENPKKYTIMDSGAIYVWTQNAGTIIRFNYIHDYNGMRENRGIYLDDGAHHVSVYGNIVMNVPNCHTIDSRRVPGTEKSKNKVSFSETNNIDNNILYNITNGTINFVGNERKDNGCVIGSNVIVLKGDEEQLTHFHKPLLANVEKLTDDIPLSFEKHSVKGVKVDKHSKNIIKELPFYKKISQWIYE